MYPVPRIVRLGHRELAVEDSGPGSGFPILVHNGAGSRHLFPGAVREARRDGFRLIGYDRPGLGGSTAMPGRVVADCADDVRAVLADLGISRAAVWGSSAGGPYALATAVLLPETVAAVCLFAPLGPYGEPGLDFAAGMGAGFREEIRVFFEEPERARADFRAGSAEFAPLASSASWWLNRWAERAGKDAAHSQEWADYLALCNRDGFSGGDEGWWEDWNASFHRGASTLLPSEPRSACGTACGIPRRRPPTRAGSRRAFRTSARTSRPSRITPTSKSTTVLRRCAGPGSTSHQTARRPLAEVTGHRRWRGPHRPSAGPGSS